ncbi:hypothetical protein PR202_gb00500 [Eleusine coracana subsp. coracana]|uniref:Uncharacterized protein n=1 Tax=Eleusine coracana subsp. coracana TaxID=191504 RepID=A0AAV5DT94_ELECO|nr:hypothetical protein PR202_gb00500 [Eleusine coracana subsp. coracana]
MTSINSSTYSTSRPPLLATTVVAELKATVERHLGHVVHRVVVTIPQHFGQAATWEAVLTSELAGLEVDADGDTVPPRTACTRGWRRGRAPHRRRLS